MLRSRIPSHALPAAFAASLALAACEQFPAAPGGKAITPTPGPPPLQVAPYLSANYGISGSDVRFVAEPDTSWDCEATPPAFRLDGHDTVAHEYRLRGDTLLFMYESELRNLRETSSGPVYLTEAETYLEYRRAGAGGGDGLEGRWQSVGWVHRVVRGVIPGADLKAKQEELSDWNRFYDLVTLEMEFTGNDLHFRMAGRLAEWWVLDFQEMNRPDESWPSGLYDMEVTARGRDTVIYHGRKTGETVTLVIEGNRARVSSDNPSHPPYYERSHGNLNCEERKDYRWRDEFRKANENPQVIRPALP